MSVALTELPSILQRILATKAEEVAERRASCDLNCMRARAADAPPARGFADRLRAAAEIKILVPY